MSEEPQDIFEIIGENVDMTNFCGREYWKWEDNVAIPKLTELGYTNIGFYNIEADSFGPLIRGGIAFLDGKQVKFCYG